MNPLAAFRQLDPPSIASAAIGRTNELGFSILLPVSANQIAREDGREMTAVLLNGRIEPAAIPIEAIGPGQILARLSNAKWEARDAGG